MKLHNFMESSVEHFLPNLLIVFPNICKCEKCILDIKALALNALPPHYVASTKGDMYSRIDEMNVQFETDVLKALIDAIGVVSKRPKHTEEDK